MKRKRGQRSGHKKEKKEIEPEQIISSDSEPEAEAEPEPETDEMEINPQPEPEPENKVNPKPEPSKPPAGQVVYSRVRVKIKSPVSIPIEPRQTSSEKSNGQWKPQLEREDSGISDLKTPKFGNTFSRKFTGIKIKTNKSLTPPSASASASGDTERNIADDLAGVSDRRNDAELNTALTVIRKIMRMEAAAPFNEPVDPIALGIPDYFDVIDTPMDFGTICKEIERGHKYMNSEDVYRDVKLIWQNCYQYNNKGDFIIDLMRRVKKNFSKYWGAAGLSVMNHYVQFVNYSFTFEGPAVVSNDNPQTEEGAQSGQDKALSKSKLKKNKKKRSTMDHKSDCMCAVCTIRRRKLEKENPSMTGTRTINLEEKSASEAGASSMDHSPGPDHIEHNSRRNDNSPLNKGIDNQLSNDNINNSNNASRSNQAPQLHLSENDGSDESDPTSDEELEYKEKDGNDDNNATSQPKETYNKIHPPKKNEILMENHAVLDLCRSLFNDSTMSRRAWQSSRQPIPVQNSPIFSAVASLLKR